MRSYLVTGASGFIGSSLSAHLAESGGAVRAVVRVASRAPVGSLPIIVPDIASPIEWATALEGVDAVIHAAGRAHVLRERAADPLARFRQVNRDATLRLAEAAARAGVRCFVYLSSIGVLGESTAAAHPFTERSPAAPTVPYAVSKWEAELALRELAAASGMQVVVIRPPLVHGPGAPGNFSRLVKFVAKGWPLPFAGIDNQRTFIGLQNLIEFIAAAIVTPAAIGSPLLPTDLESVSTPRLVQMIGEGLGRPVKLFRVPGLQQLGRMPITGRGIGKLTGSLEVDGTASWRRVGRTPRVSLRASLDLMTMSYRSAANR